MLKHLKLQIPYDLDSPERTVYHREIIRNKPFLKKLYEEWYGLFNEQMKLFPEGKVVELGSGGGFLKETAPSVICSDVLELPTNDMTFSALDMPFDNEELAGVLMIDTFHHIPDGGQFLNEAERVLKKGGYILMIEPANSLWGRYIYRNFHHEPFEPGGGWTIPASGPLSGANGALPWIVFERDASDFQSRFPGFVIEQITYHSPFRYLVSGGVSFKQLVPNWSFGFFSALDRFASSVWPQLSMFVTIKLRKQS